eukprot:375468-Prymnesium_polylepis.2
MHARFESPAYGGLQHTIARSGWGGLQGIGLCARVVRARRLVHRQQLPLEERQPDRRSLWLVGGPSTAAADARRLPGRVLRQLELAAALARDGPGRADEAAGAHGLDGVPGAALPVGQRGVRGPARARGRAEDATEPQYAEELQGAPGRRGVRCDGAATRPMAHL